MPHTVLSLPPHPTPTRLFSCSLACVVAGFVRDLLEPLKDGRVRLLLNAGDHANMQESLKKCLKNMGIDFRAS